MNEQGKHSLFLFLGMVATISEKLRNNDDLWFRKFTNSRRKIEEFFIEHKSLIEIVLQNLNKTARTPRMRDLFNLLVSRETAGESLDPHEILSLLGIGARVYDVTVATRSSDFSDDTKSRVFYRDAIAKQHICHVCGGRLDVAKSVSYDHITPRRSGGLGTTENAQMVHPYCNTAVKN